MSKLFNLTFYPLSCLLLLLSHFTYLSAQEKKPLTFEDIWGENAFQVKNVPGFNALRNGKQYSKIDNLLGQEINIYNLSDGKKVKNVLRKPDEISNIDQYSFSNDEQKMLLLTEAEPIYRRSILYKVWVYDIRSKTVQAIDKGKVLHATFNPAGTKVAYVKDNNIFIYDLPTKSTIAVTHDGLKNQIINGNCDWVYEEEFGFTRAFEWSPDGNYLAFYRFDESAVKEFTIQFYDENDNYPRNYTYKYPKAGEDNSVVTIHIYDVNKKETHAADIGEETDQYIPRIKWARQGNNNNLCIYRLNRLQNKLELLLENAGSRTSRIIYSEESPYYIDINDNLSFLPDGRSFILNSERDGFNHLYRWDWKSKTLKQLTTGDWDIDKIIGVDEEKELVYYTAGVESPLERKMYAVGWDGKTDKCLTPQSGVHNIIPCYGFKYFIAVQSGLNSVPVYRLIDAEGQTIRILEDNKALAEKMDEYVLSPIELLTLPNKDGERLNAWMIKPHHFDPANKYPVLMYQYSGPGSQEVMDKFPINNYFWHQMIAQKGYIVVCVDGTGTGGRGREFKNKTYLNLGKYESEDQIAAAEYLAAQGYVDEGRIGIWGWSYGGFMSITCILKGADVFKTAVAVAPVTNWRFYDNIYTERYMRQPKDNARGYDDNAPEQMAALLKGNLLIIHGLADDNVHFQNAAVLTNELVKANKQFESEYYPNKNHSLYGGVTREQLFRRITAYLYENL